MNRSDIICYQLRMNFRPAIFKHWYSSDNTLLQRKETKWRDYRFWVLEMSNVSLLRRKKISLEKSLCALCGPVRDTHWFMNMLDNAYICHYLLYSMTLKWWDIELKILLIKIVYLQPDCTVHSAQCTMHMDFDHQSTKIDV